MAAPVTIPASASTMDVSIIDSTMWMDGVPGIYNAKPIYPGMETHAVPSFSYLLEHKRSHRRLLFDLGLRKDFQTGLNPFLMEALNNAGMKISVERDVPDILVENHMELKSIEAIAISHHHFDHIGNPSRFPPTTKLVVGPGFKNPGSKLVPGYPADPEAHETTSDSFEGREVQEFDLSTATLQIGGYPALDYFDDGSLYILATPGHTHSHISALVRTSAAADGQDSTFIFLGGDISHHCVCFRPSPGRPLPREVPGSTFGQPEPCSTDPYMAIHRSHGLGDEDGSSKAFTQSFCIVDSAGLDDDPAKRLQSLNAMVPFDAMENVFTMIAHDRSFLGVLDFFPKKVTDWKAKGWKETCHWRFLNALDKAVGKPVETPTVARKPWPYTDSS